VLNTASGLLILSKHDQHSKPCTSYQFTVERQVADTKELVFRKKTLLGDLCGRSPPQEISILLLSSHVSLTAVKTSNGSVWGREGHRAFYIFQIQSTCQPHLAVTTASAKTLLEIAS
jgi:hypothetical protein